MKAFRIGMMAAALCAAGAAAAQTTDNASFDLRIRGISAGSLVFSGVQEGAGYAVNGKLQSGGLVGMLKRVRYDAQAQGRISKGRYVPSSYSEAADTGKRQSQAVMGYRAGVPQVTQYQPAQKPRSYDVDPSTQGGTVDPLTALYATLRDVDAGQECNRSLQIFDGRRRTELVLGAPQATAAGVSCAGEFRRVAGYSADDMAEKTRFPFTLSYAPVEGGRMRVVEVATDTLYGRATLTRR